MPSPTRNYQGATAENRINTRRSTLIEKGFELMASDEWRQVSINSLCRDAQLNKRYFYENFSDLAELEDAVVDHLAASLLGVGLAAAQDAARRKLDQLDMSKQVLAAAIEWLTVDRRRPRVLFSGASGNPRAQAHRKSVIRYLALELSSFGQQYHETRESVSAPHAGAPIALAGSALLIGGSIELLQSWLDGDVDLSFDELVDSIASYWVAIGNDAVAQARRRKAAAAAKASTKAPAKAPPKPRRKR